jgi:hypothetical protein
MKQDALALRRRMLVARNDATVLGHRAWRLRMQALTLALRRQAAK